MTPITALLGFSILIVMNCARHKASPVGMPVDPFKSVRGDGSDEMSLNVDQVSVVKKIKGPGYESYFSGNQADVHVDLHGGVLLVGGDEDRDDAMQWFVDKAGRGDIVILRTDGADGYNSWLMEKGADSVESIVFKNRSASNDPEVLKRINSADGIFFAGGDQSEYIKYWKDTELSKLINAMIARGVPVGGTSAGLAILGQFVYPAFHNSASSLESLSDPFNKDVMIEKDFLNIKILSGIITDSHFRARDRAGRLLTFMARILNARWTNTVFGIGIDEMTALGVDANGVGRVFSDQGHVYAYRTTRDPEVCTEKKPLKFGGIEVIKLNAGDIFSIPTWSGKGSFYSLSADDGVITSSNGSVY
jgi:cyanophycinase